jgi:hypothetical protein
MDLTGIGSVFDFGGKLLDKIFPDETQRAAAKLELFKAQQAGEFKEMDQAFEIAKAQIAVNSVEAASDNAFVAGWRPAIGWICGVSLAYSAIIEPIARFVAAVGFKYVGVFPIIDSTITMQLLFALLGLGAMRSFDKKNNIK